jgi:TetR/AcrR family fatty acid metabolism transcriptional regulator
MGVPLKSDSGADETKATLKPTPEASEAAGKKPEKYQRILDAAIEVIAEKGFVNSRVSDIALRAGVADGTVYLYFKNKDQILMSALNSAFTAFIEKARSETGRLDSAAERLRILAQLHLAALARNPSLAVVFQMELRQSARILGEFSQHRLVEYFDLIRGIIRDGQEKGTFRSDVSDRIAASCLFGSLDELVTAWVLRRHDFDLVSKADAVVDLFFRGIDAR